MTAEASQKESLSNKDIKERLREESEDNLVHVIRNITDSGHAIKIAVSRVKPKTWPGRIGSIAGKLETFDEPISIEDIKEEFGGGTYDLQFSIPGKGGSWEYVTNRRIQIAGDPIFHDGIETHKANSSEEPSVVKEVLHMAQQTARDAQIRAERIEERARTASDPSINMMADQLNRSGEQLAESQRVIYELMNRQNDSSPANALLSKMMDNESARIAQLRAQHESELRAKNEMHQAEIQRIHDRNEQNARWMQESHKREIDTLTRSLTQQDTLLKVSYDGQTRALERELDTVRADLAATRSELAELRAKKEKGLVESLTEIASVKEALSAFGGGEDKEEGSTIERILSGVMSSPLAEGVAARLAGGAGMAAMTAAPQPQAPEEADIPVNRPFPLPDGTIGVRRPDGAVVRLRQKKPPVPGSAEALKLDPQELQVAVQFMEAAVSKDTDPEQFAATARNLVPANILAAIRTQGVDAFLANVAKLEDSSPLATMHGKNWVRKVAAALIGG